MYIHPHVYEVACLPVRAGTCVRLYAAQKTHLCVLTHDTRFTIDPSTCAAGERRVRMIERGGEGRESFVVVLSPLQFFSSPLTRAFLPDIL